MTKVKNYNKYRDKVESKLGYRYKGVKSDDEEAYLENELTFLTEDLGSGLDCDQDFDQVLKRYLNKTNNQ